MKKYFDALTGLKVMAMLLIFWWHSPLPNPAADLGARCCEILYVLSGFLIAYKNRNNHENVSLSDSINYVLNKRAGVWVLNFLTMVLAMIILQQQFTKQNIVIALTNIMNLQNWFSFRTFNGATWFLCPLMFCYFIYPVLLRCVKKKKQIVFFFFLAIALRYFIEVNNGFLWDISVHTNPIVRCLEFFLGILVFKLFEIWNIKREEIGNKFILFTVIEPVALGIYIYLIVKMNSVWNRADFVLLHCAIVFLLAIEGGGISKILGTKPFRLFSRIQLYFFIFHTVVIYEWHSIAFTENINCYIASILIFAVTVGLSVLYLKFFAVPFANMYVGAVNRFLRTLDYNFQIRKVR